MIQAIDQLGIAVRAEAAHIDGVNPDPADLFTEGSMRRRRLERESQQKAREPRQQMGAVPDPPDQDD